MQIDKLAGIAVASLAEGTELGQVEVALFDPATLQLRAFQAKGDGQSFIVPWGLVEFGTLQRLQIVDAAGTLRDLELGPLTEEGA